MRRLAKLVVDFLSRVMLGVRQGLVSMVAALCAYAPTHFVGLQQGFWSAITALAVAQAEFKESRTTAWRQCAGAALGGAAGLGLGLAFGAGLAVYAGAVVLSVLLCRTLNVPDASQLAGITATIVLLVPRTGSMEVMLVSRLSEVAWGAAMGLLVVWVENNLVRKL